MFARRDVRGLMMILASLGIVGVVLLLVAQRDRLDRRAEIRHHGASLANTLARLPQERLAPSEGRKAGWLESIGTTRAEPDFAYAVFVDREGRPLARVTAADLVLPEMAPPTLDPSSWHDERLLALPGFDGIVRQFSAPVLEAGELVGQVRLAYREPQLDLLSDELSWNARLALVVFLCMPMAALWLRSELRPLQAIAREIDGSRFQPDGGASIAADASSVERLVEHFRAFTDELEHRSEEMEQERLALVASTKVLAHQKNRTEQALDAMPDAVLMLDPSGTLLLANARASSLLRVPREELKGSSASIWSPAAEVTQLVQRHTGDQAGTRRSDRVEFSLRETDPRTFLASIHPLPEATGSLLVLRDVSEERSARETQSEFLGHMAHELKAPLNVISLYRESLLQEGEDENLRVEACNVIADEVDRLNGLIGNIFSISRIENGVVGIERQRIRLRELLVDVFDSTKRDDQQGDLAFTLEAPESLSPVFADKQLLSIALKNLLTNAIKYNRTGGAVILRAREEDEGLFIEVVDTGVGIPEEDLGLVFDKFYRAEDVATQKVAGHGLGLALVKEIVSLHGGEIQVESQLGEGSTFRLFFGSGSAVFREEF